MANLITNEYFLDHVRSYSGREELAQGLETVIKLKLEEVSFLGKILPAENISHAETYIDEKTNTRYVLVPRRHPSKLAVQIPFVGDLKTDYIKDDRFRVNFYWLETPAEEIDVKELENLQVPIEQWVQENQALAIDKMIDGRFIDICDALVAANGQLVEIGHTDDNNITRDDYVSLKQKIQSAELPIGMMLMTDTTNSDILRWKHSEVGDDIVGKLVINGVTFNTIHGDPYITTIKHALMMNSQELTSNKGVIYMFTTPEYFGVFKVLHSLEFKLEYFRDKITLWTKMQLGVGIGNVNGVAKAVIYQEG